jgi:hypothetical protein
VSLSTLGDSDIDLGGKLTTFTNLQGRVYENVLLRKATLDGVIYGVTNGIGGGMVKFKDLPPEFLASLNIPADRIQVAQQREEVRAEQKKRYDAAVRALALKQQKQETLDASNALAQANAEAAAEANAATNQAAAKPKQQAKATGRRK